VTSLLNRLAGRLLASIAGVALITVVGRQIHVNSTTQGFAYLLLVLIIASAWGFVEAAVSSVLATLLFNFYFLPPIGTFTIADPQNWVALFSFLAVALIASRLSDAARKRRLEALSREDDIERLYTFSRGILLIDNSAPVPRQLAQKLAEVFALSAVVLYDRRSGEFHQGGPADLSDARHEIEEQLRDSALNGTFFTDTQRAIMAVRLGSEPIASLALEGPRVPDSVLQGAANLVAIGLERARSQELAQQLEAGRQSEQLRIALIDAMSHELKTPLTSIKAAITALLAAPGPSSPASAELVKIAAEEAEHLQKLIDNAVELARLDTARIEVRLEVSDLAGVVREVVDSMRTEIEDRSVEVNVADQPPPLPFDRRLVGLALKQLIDNALKYSPPGTPVTIRLRHDATCASIDVTNRGGGIPAAEQARIFERFYRSPSVQRRIPGSGLGLSIALRIAEAHNGDLTVMSQPGETAFRFTLPLAPAARPEEGRQLHPRSPSA
jgi:two-component system, OmpR family, sensor histidine kinase KdpD